MRQLIAILKKILRHCAQFLLLIMPIVRYYFFARGSGLTAVKYIIKHDKCIVIGNGPSLRNDLDEILKQRLECDFIVVNHFAESEFFNVIAPGKYVLLDAYFWAEDCHLDLKEKRNKLFDSLHKVSWQMQLFVPEICDKDFIEAKVTNKNIEIIFFKMVSLDSSVVNIVEASILYKYSPFAPAACNVLIYAIFIGIKAGYDFIDIYGADLSFHSDVVVDQKNNIVKIKYKHFYGDTDYVPLLKNPLKIEPFSMFELMELTTNTFFSHASMQLYAKQGYIQITNRSSYSLIDVYSRVN
jgi:hypothetical protein